MHLEVEEAVEGQNWWKGEMLEDEFQKLYHRNKNVLAQKKMIWYIADMKRRDVDVPNIIPFLF